jgi:hypothetical protein
MERELRPAVHGGELLTHESEIDSHDRAGQPRPGLVQRSALPGLESSKMPA